MSIRRTIAFATGALIIATMTWGSVYTYRKGFTKKWRGYVNEAFEQRGIGAKIGKLTLDPLEGLVARDVEFYRTPEKRRLLAVIDRIALDVDLGELVRKENFLNAITVDGADLTIPLEDKAGSETIAIRNLHANARFPGGSIDVGAITGEFYGTRFSIRGTLLRPEPPPPKAVDPPGAVPPPTPERAGNAGDTRPDSDIAHRPLVWIYEHREQLQRAVDWIGRFTLDEEEPPTLEIDLTGDLGKPGSLRATFLASSGALTYESFTAHSVQAEASYTSSGIEIRSLKISDELGELNAFARYATGEDEIPFTVDSTIDLPALVGAVFGREKLGEFIVYEPVQLALEGHLLLPGARVALPPGLPARFTGNMSTGRFASRGTIFTGLGADFAYEPGRYLIRNALVEHRSGTAGFQATGIPGGALRFDARIGLDPQIFIPFSRREGTRKFLKRVALGPDSTLRVDASGHGPGGNPDTWEIDATIEGRDFQFNGVPVERFEAGFHSIDRVQTYTDALVVRPEGTLRANKVRNETIPKIITIDTAVSTANPQATAAYFSEELAETLTRFQFERPPTLTLTGTYDIGAKEKTDFEAEIVSGDDNPLAFPLLGSDLHFQGAQGRIRILRSNIGMNFTGRATPGCAFHRLSFPSGADVAVQGWLQKDSIPATDITVEVATGSAAPAIVRFAGRDLPVQDAKSTVHVVDSVVDTTLSGKLFGGSIDVETTLLGVGDDAAPPYTSAGTVEGVSLRDLTRTFGSANETGGYLEGDFSLTGRAGDSASVDGNAAVTLKNGNIYSIPIFGPLSPLVTAVVPGDDETGYSVSREASANISATGGVIRLESFEALTPAFRLRSSGTIDYVNNALDLRATMNLRGAPGLLLTPISKLFEYEATGTTQDPGWRSATMSVLTGGREKTEKPDADD